MIFIKFTDLVCKCCQEGPRPLQELSRSAPEAFGTPHWPPRWLQEASRSVQETSKSHPETSKSSPECSREASKRSPGDPQVPLECSRRRRDAQEASQSPPRHLQQVSQTPPADLQDAVKQLLGVGAGGMGRSPSDKHHIR